MSVCYFGTYERNYPRNSIFLEGLRRNAVTVFECHVPLWEKTVTKGEKFGFSITFILRFFIAQFRLLFRYVFFIPKHDIIIVGYIGHLDIFLAKMIAFFGRKKLVFNPLVSLYDTVIVDRGYFTTSSIKARLMRFLDRSACKMSDVVLLDTEAHIQYFRNELDLPNINFKRLFVGADDRLFSPEQTAKPKNNFHVMFIGKFIPLHGIEKIIEFDELQKLASAYIDNIIKRNNWTFVSLLHKFHFFKTTNIFLKDLIVGTWKKPMKETLLWSTSVLLKRDNIFLENTKVWRLVQKI